MIIKKYIVPIAVITTLTTPLFMPVSLADTQTVNGVTITTTLDPVKNTDQTVTGTTTDTNATVTVYDVYGNQLGPATTASGNNFSINLYEPLVFQSEIVVKVSDSSGNSTSFYQQVTSVTPTLSRPSLNSSTNVNNNNKYSFVFTGTATSGKSVFAAVTDGKSAVYSQSATVQPDGTFTIPPVNLSTLHDGALSVEIIQSDGTQVSSITTTALQKGTVTPIAPIVNPVRESDTVVTGLAQLGASIQVYDFNRNLLGSGSTNASTGVFSIPVPSLSGVTNLYVDITDQTGNSTEVKVAVEKTYTGYIYDADGSGQVGAVVRFYKNGIAVGSATTDKNGAYNASVPADTYDVNVNVGNRLTYIKKAVQITSTTSDADYRVSTTQDANYGTIQGKVTDPYGKPVFAYVQLSLNGDSSQTWTCVTDAKGMYSIGALPDGTYDAWVYQSDATTPYMSSANNPIGAINLQVTKRQTVTQNFSIGGSGTPIATTTTSVPTVDVTNGSSITDSNGATIVNASVNDLAFSSALSNLQAINSSSDNGITNQPTVIVTVKGQADQVQTHMDASLFKQVAMLDSNAVVGIKTSLGMLSIPVKSVQEAIQHAGLSIDNALVTITQKNTDLPTTLKVGGILQQQGTIPYGNPVEYDVRISNSDGSNSINLSNSSCYLSHTIDLPAVISSQLLPSQLTGVAVDPDTGTFRPVPTVFSVTAEGGLEATIFDKGNSMYTIVQDTKSFTDVPEEYYAKDAIDTLADKLVVNGYQDGTFQPQNQITRAEFASMLIRALGIQPDTSTNIPFHDVSKGDWYASSVAAAVKAGLISGYSNGTFHPNATITREEMLQMVVNAMKQSGFYQSTLSQNDINLILSKYTDKNEVHDWAKEAEAIAINDGIISGTSANQLAPESTANRGQSATILYRMLKKLNLIN